MKNGKSRASKAPTKGRSTFSIFPRFLPSEKRINEFQQKLREGIDPGIDDQYKLKESKFSDMRKSFCAPKYTVDLSRSSINLNRRTLRHLSDHSVHYGELLHAHIHGEGDIFVFHKFKYKQMAIIFYIDVVVTGYHIGGRDVLVRSYCCSAMDESNDEEHDYDEEDGQPDTQNDDDDCDGDKSNESVEQSNESDDSDEILLYRAFETYVDIQSAVIEAKFDGTTYPYRMTYECLRNSGSTSPVSRIHTRRVFEHKHITKHDPIVEKDLEEPER